MTLEELQAIFPDATEETWHRHPNGCGWVQNTATVADTAYVGPYALVYGNAQVYDNAKIRFRSRVYGNAVVCDGAEIAGNARVAVDAKVYESARVYGTAAVYGSARVRGNAAVYDDALVCGNALIAGSSRICGNARVYGNAAFVGRSRVSTGEFYGSKEQDFQNEAPELPPSIPCQTLLQEAEAIINGPRATDYGTARENIGRIARLWSAVLGMEVTPEQVILCMIQVKTARLCHSPTHEDSWMDIAGYVGLWDKMRRGE